MVDVPRLAGLYFSELSGLDVAVFVQSTRLHTPYKIAIRCIQLASAENCQSLQVVADAVGASRGHIWEVETGRTKNPSLDLVRRLADHYGVSVGWIVGEVDEENVDQETTALYRTLQSLSPQNRQHIQAIIDSMRKTEA